MKEQQHLLPRFLCQKYYVALTSQNIPSAKIEAKLNTQSSHIITKRPDAAAASSKKADHNMLRTLETKKCLAVILGIMKRWLDFYAGYDHARVGPCKTLRRPDSLYPDVIQ